MRAEPTLRISCVLTSYNRPRLVRQALRSVQDQTYLNYELIVADESDIFDIERALGEFSVASVVLLRFRVTPQERARVNRLSVNINAALRKATGDLLCFLADDDFLLPRWFEHAAAFFAKRPEVHNAYGRLYYSRHKGMLFPLAAKQRFPRGPLKNPYCNLDHNQVVHRKVDPPVKWPENVDHALTAPDGLYFNELARRGAFHPIDAGAAVKRFHNKNLQQCAAQYRQGSLDPLRE